MKDLLKIKLNLGTKKDMLKLSLDQKEIIQYNAYKNTEEGSKDRSALDKVVARLKLEDESWLEQEAELVILKNKASVVNNIVEVLQSYLNSGMSIDDVDKLVQDYIKEFDLGEYL